MSSMFSRDLYGFMQDSDIGRNLSNIGVALNELVIIEKYKALKAKQKELTGYIEESIKKLDAAKSYKMIFTSPEDRANFISKVSSSIEKDRKELAFIFELIDTIEQYLFHGEVRKENDISEEDEESSQNEQSS